MFCIKKTIHDSRISNFERFRTSRKSEGITGDHKDFIFNRLSPSYNDLEHIKAIRIRGNSPYID
eukprot:scaffold171327_cov15-Tisochrysis_lutea.AAC.1